ncbi:type I secretion system permease/ATPase [Larsenimonas rhizosphaerae]|uniref:Type I secretion system permease/ATPase n=1 Tax=Larsenimonas rhizosphaerae TaxID=2944682 RepID=A0AA41ZDC8_9GAMM|nr:type I secretion system permease/ATPase [Larsenimonas rhizosphaerae]MCX2522747.1 type I secretion system permease/ATPase [Larsenimonas rhizosphaerae]
MAGIHTPTELQQAISACRGSFIAVGIFSMFINVLMLVPPLYMLQIYDRVISTRSIDTLLMLTLIVVFFFLVMGGLELVRSRLMVRVGNRLDTLLSERLYSAMFHKSLSSPAGQTAQPLTDLTTLRQFLTGNAPFAFFDAPWIPIYIGVLFLFHAWLGVFAIAAGLVLLGLALANEWATRTLLTRAGSDQLTSQQLATANLANAEVVHAMGILPGLRARWARHHHQYLLKQSRASDRAGALINASKVMRLLCQSMILGLGALLAIEGELSPGMMIAGSILMGRALAPIDQMMAAWKGFIGARSAHERLQTLFRETSAEQPRMALPTPTGNLHLENISAAPPGARKTTLRGITLSVARGEHIGIIGPSASGKSTLARVALGLWPTQTGKVRLDGADITQWDREALGPSIGYLPQDIELFDGTISDNIARFGDVDPAAVVEAARWAGVHEMILQQPDGYDTWISSSRGVLSGGQRQRIGLARALYGKPVLVVLDEPNSNLDDSGEKALAATLERLRAEQITLLVISHRHHLLAHVDKLLVLKDGRMGMFGPRDEVIGHFKRQRQPAPEAAPTRVQASAMHAHPTARGSQS